MQPVGPGGSLDVLTRVAARKLAAITGQPVVVDNRPGTPGLIALQASAKASADGYTLISIPGPILFSQRAPELGKELMAVAALVPLAMLGVTPVLPHIQSGKLKGYDAAQWYIVGTPVGTPADRVAHKARLDLN